MPDKLTDTEIKKALECCSGKGDCRSCPYKSRENCTKDLKLDVADLINHQKAAKGGFNRMDYLQKALERDFPLEICKVCGRRFYKTSQWAYKLPSEELIISFCSSVHIPEEIGCKFYDYYSPRNWMTTRGSDISGCWKEKLLEWEKREKPTKKDEKNRSHASYNWELVDKLMNSDD